jgi:hypothetical protein
MTATAMPGTVAGTGRRHRVVAIGSGLGGLTAAKALKHGQLNITDAVVFLTRMTAQGSSHVANQTSLWLQVIPITASAFATSGVLVTLYVAVARGRKRAATNPDTTGSVTRKAPHQSISVATGVCGVLSGLGKAGADHAIHRIA